MKNQLIQMQVGEAVVRTKTPYQKEFVDGARKLRGSFKEGSWVFDLTMIDHVRQLMIESFGVTGETPYEECVLVVTNFKDTEICAGIELFGRPITKAWGRDSGAKLQEGIFLIRGDHGSGGSMKNWNTWINGDIEIHGFPVAALSWPLVHKYIAEGKCTVKGQDNPVQLQIQDLERQKEALQAQIDKLKQDNNLQ